MQNKLTRIVLTVLALACTIGTYAQRARSAVDLGLSVLWDAQPYTYSATISEALALANTYSDQGGWRLPTVAEMEELDDLQKRTFASDGTCSLSNSRGATIVMWNTDNWTSDRCDGGYTVIIPASSSTCSSVTETHAVHLVRPRPVEATDFTIACSAQVLYPGEVYDLQTLNVVPENAEISVVYTSSDPTVLLVDGTQVKAIRVGSATITATTNGFSSISRSITLTVSAYPLVDLQLPSGVKWTDMPLADFRNGSRRSSFMWGESADPAYPSAGYRGGELELPEEYDAARYILGSSLWAIPSKENWDELLSSASGTTWNDMGGRWEVTGQNGMTIHVSGEYWTRSTEFASSGQYYFASYSAGVVPYTGGSCGPSSKRILAVRLPDPTGVSVASSTTIPLGSRKELTAKVLPKYTRQSVVWSSADERIVSVTESGVMTAKAMGTTTLTVASKSKPSIKTTVRVTVTEPEYVDLGLGDGTMWATHNIGALNPEEDGKHFYFGATDGAFEGETNPYGRSFPRGVTTLPLEKDAAHLLYGGQWLIPSDQQWEDLITKCQWTWDAERNGYIVSGNGNSIFLWAGYFRTSSLQTDNGENLVTEVYLDSDEKSVETRLELQSGANPIRPVKVQVSQLMLQSKIVTLSTPVKLKVRTVPSVVPNLQLVWSSSNTAVATVDNTGKVTGVAPGTAVISVAMADGSLSAQCEVQVTNEAVDLGIGVKWAVSNLGATESDPLGDYYAWGETAPKSSYTQANYTYPDGEGNRPEVLPTTHDAARVDWGSPWRMPTADEFQRLLTDCSWTWLSAENSPCGIAGYKVSGLKPGYENNSIFLPAGGYAEGDEIKTQDMLVYYTSKLSKNGNRGWSMRATETFYEMSAVQERYQGALIRPVVEERPYGVVGVDMGDLYWADANLGAFFEYNSGNFYQWGSLSGANADSPECTWTSYPMANGSMTSLKAYNTDTNFGQTDGKSMLQTDDNAAAILGEGWRLPTEAEIRALENPAKYTWTWYEAGNTVFAGVAGYQVTSRSTGNAIFLPATGYYAGNTLTGAGKLGAYWTSELARWPYAAFYMCFDKMDQCIGWGDRCEGRVIRAVKSK